MEGGLKKIKVMLGNKTPEQMFEKEWLGNIVEFEGNEFPPMIPFMPPVVDDGGINYRYGWCLNFPADDMTLTIPEFTYRGVDALIKIIEGAKDVNQTFSDNKKQGEIDLLKKRIKEMEKDRCKVDGEIFKLLLKESIPTHEILQLKQNGVI